MGFKATLDLIGNGCTFGELEGFLALGRRLGLQYDDQVLLEMDDQHDVVVGLTITSETPVNLAPRELPFDQREQWVEALNKVIESDGDARGAVTYLSEIRDRLRDES